MPFLISSEGEARILTELQGGAAAEDWTLGLFVADITPAESDTLATYAAQEATFAGYARKPLTRTVSGATWSVPALQDPAGSPPWSTRAKVAYTQYGSAPQSWTFGGAGETVYGYFIAGADSGTLILAEKLATPVVASAGAVLDVTPTFAYA